MILGGLELPCELGLRTGLDFLVTREWELEQAYERLFDVAQQHAPATAEVLALLTPAEELASGRSAAILCPPPNAPLLELQGADPG